LQPNQIRTGYTNFFKQSDAGAYFIDALKQMIADSHEKSEKNPESARDNAQRAAGIREVLNHISSYSAEIKRKSPIERGEQ